MTDFLHDVPNPVAFASDTAAEGSLAYRVYDPERLVAGKRMEGRQEYLEGEVNRIIWSTT